MLALSIRQPWAWVILNCGKDIENRSWPTRVRGRVLIHASKTMPKRELQDSFDVRNIKGNDMAVIFPAYDELDRCGNGCRWGVENASSPWGFGPYGFVLRCVRELPFRPCHGLLGFWEADA